MTDFAGLPPGTVISSAAVDAAFAAQAALIATNAADIAANTALAEAAQTAATSAAAAVAALPVPPYTYADLPPELASVPLCFVLPGSPAAGQVFNLVVPFACTIPADFAGVVCFASTAPAANAMFAVNQVSGGATVQIGTLTLQAASATGIAASAQAAATLAPGDVLQLMAPTAQDATLADLGISFLAGRV